MCGRFTLTTSPGALASLLDIDPEEIVELQPRYNIAPTQLCGIARCDAEGRRRWTVARWGLVPSWAKDAGIGSRMINARAETVAEKPAFRAALARRRCLVPATGFYEWKRSEHGKRPYLIRQPDGRPMALAGLWERCQPAGGEPLESFTIITTHANRLMAPLHHRMPVILGEDLLGEWLAPHPLSRPRLESVLRPCDPDRLEAFEVAPVVNSPANDTPECIRPLGTPA
jgi:putative SOS response-associated peptidase YedK